MISIVGLLIVVSSVFYRVCSFQGAKLVVLNKLAPAISPREKLIHCGNEPNQGMESPSHKTIISQFSTDRNIPPFNVTIKIQKKPATQGFSALPSPFPSHVEISWVGW